MYSEKTKKEVQKVVLVTLHLFVPIHFFFKSRYPLRSKLKIPQSRVFEGKVLHLLYCLFQSQIARAFQSLTQIQHEELQHKKRRHPIKPYAEKPKTRKW